MKLSSALLKLFLITIFSLICTSAFAQAGDRGFDVRLGVDFSAVIYDVKVDSGLKIGDVAVTSKDNADPDSDMIGVGGSISFGYRWKYVGVYLDHTIGGLWWTDNDEKKDDGSLLTAWFVSAHGFFPISNSFELEGAIGIGGALSDGDRPFKGDGSINPEYSKPAIIFDKHGNPTPCPALHFGIGLTYYLTSYLGIGYFFDYNLMINTYKYEYSYSILHANADVTRLLHQINTGVHVKFRF